ncbi:MAG TPA: kelch repeat-containing protein [Blastocatellia bacterium]|nr:kelch repeat-containing protein [Blastocatellia bacterium]
MSGHRFPVIRSHRIFSLFIIAASLAGVYAVRSQFAQDFASSSRSPLQALSSQPLPVARYLHTATLLPNGKVLVVGGTSTGDAGGALRSALLYDPFKTDWTPVAAPGAERYGHIAVLLRNGNVLVAGGRNNSGLLRSAEIYDPVANNWTATGAMSANRFRATATLLAYASNAGPAGTSNPRNGAAMVIGGEGDTGALATAEFYNPATGVWQSTGAPMRARRIGHTATQLLSGDVLVAGGYATASQPMSGVEIYDPLADRWRTVGGLRAARFGHTATLLTTGQVMAVGGLGGNGAALDSSELFDPINHRWTTVQSALAQARAYHSATLQPNGSLIVIGGFGSAAGAGVKTAESYDPTSTNLRQWVAAGDFQNERGAHTATLLASARVLIVGGAASGAATSPLSSVELHDPAAGQWGLEKPMSRARVEHTATLLANGKVLVAGGRDANSSMKSAELYTLDPNNNVGAWSPTADLNVARHGHTATLLANGKVLVAGGVGGGQFLNSAEVYDPIAGGWTLTANSMPNAREDHTATLLPNGKVLLTGGRNSLGVIRSCDIYDPATNSWTGAMQLNQFRANHTATLLYDGRVLAAGGLGAASLPAASLANSELYDFTTNRWTNVPSQMLPTGHHQHTATLLPNGKVLLVSGLRGASGSVSDYAGTAHLFDPSRSQWDSVSAPAGRVKHTATLLPNGKALIVGGYTIQSTTGGLTTVLGNSVQLYDPALGTSLPFTTAPILNDPRDGHTATLLPNGKVLVTGGIRQSVINGTQFVEFLRSAETFDAGLGVDELAATVSPFVTSATWSGPGNPLCAAGIRFQGVSEAAGGGSPGSNTNYPILQLMRIDNGQQYYLSPDPASAICATKGWANNGYGSLTVPATTSPGTNNNMHPGPAMLTVFVNGIPNRRSMILGVPGGQSADSPTVNLSGRIHTVADSGLPATVELRGSDGSVRIARSGPNGEYVFDNVPTQTQTTSVSAVTPNQILVGSPNAQITVTGSGFRPIGATIPNQILLNGQPLTTIFDSPTQLRATIPSQFLQTAGFASVAVRILNSNGSTSITPPVPIEITSSSPAARPEIRSLNPPSTPAGTTGLQVAINGLNLLNGTTQVLWNGQSRSFSSGSNTQLVFSPLASDLAQAGAARVQVVNAGGASNEVTFTVTQSGPSITSLNPSSYAAPTSASLSVSALTLTVNGAGFQSNSVVRANGSNLVTNFVSANQLRAQLGAAFLNTQSNILISVLNPSGNTLSNSVNFPINQTPAAPTGSVLLFPFYSTSSPTSPGLDAATRSPAGANQQFNDATTITLTNTNSAQGVRVSLLFVRGSNREVRTDFRFLNPNQTISVSAAQIFPNSRGYVVAVAYGQNCPINFNFLRGAAAVSLASGHSATLDAIAIRALSNPTNCVPSSPGTVPIPGFAVLNFNGGVYERVPNQVIADNIPSVRDDNITLLVVNALGGDLRTNGGPNNLGLLTGVLYDTDLAAYGFFTGFVTGNTPAQISSTLSPTFPVTTPSFENIIAKGERGKMTLFQASSESHAVFGAVLNRGPALNGGYLLRPLTTKSVSLVVPYFETVIGFTPSVERNSAGAAATETTVGIAKAPTGERANEDKQPLITAPAAAQQQPSPGAAITYTITPSANISTGQPIKFVPTSRTVTPGGGGTIGLAPEITTPLENATPLDNDDNNFCGRTSPGSKIDGTISPLNGTMIPVTFRLTNNKAPSCNLPDEVSVSTNTAGYYLADNQELEALGLDGVYLISPNHNNFNFRFNPPSDPNNPNLGLPEALTPPIGPPLLAQDFIAEPKAACPTATTATANGQSNLQICEGLTINLATPTVANATGYQWLFPDGSMRAEQNPVIASATLSNNGLYRVTVTIANCPAPIQAMVSVAVASRPIATITPGQTSVCANSTGNTASTPDAGPGAGYVWTISGGSITGGNGTRAITYTAGATGNVMLGVMVTNAASCSASGSSQVAINPPLNINAQPTSRAVCAGAPVTFSVGAIGTAPLTYQWRKNGSPIGGQTNSSFTINSAASADAGSYDVVVTSACGSATSQAATLTVNDFSLDPTSASFQAAGGSGMISVSGTVGGCAWTATKESSAVWITLGASGGVGNGSLSYTVAPNTGANSRSAMLTVAGKAFTVTQSGSAPSATLSALAPNTTLSGGDNLTVTITGTNFTNASKARWQGAERTTSFVSATQLTVEITLADLAVGGTYSIDVINPSPAVPSNTLPFTVVQTYEADVAPRPPGGNGAVTIADWALVGRYVARLETPASPAEFQRADCAPRLAVDGVTPVLGDGRLTISDWVTAGLYSSGNIPTNPPGGPRAETTSFQPLTGWAFLRSFLFGDHRFPITPDAVRRLDAEPRALRLTTNDAGGDREVVIELDADGYERALGFSLSFDSTRWRALPGRDQYKDAAGATLIINDHQAHAGRIGVVFMTPPGEALTAGRRQIATIRFAPISIPPGSEFADNIEFIRFSDEPVAREIVDAGANSLPATYLVNGARSPEILFAAALKLRADGTRSLEPASRYDASANQLALEPIDPGLPGDQVFLVLFGRGIQPPGHAAASVRIGGLNAAIHFAGEVEGFSGLDHMIVSIPREMAARGVVGVELKVGEKSAEKFQVSFK